MPIEMRIVSLEDYYANIQRSEAREAFLDMTSLRAGSYGPDYPKHYLPLDQSDYIATHHLFYIYNVGKWEIFGGVRHLNVSVLEKYKMPMPLLTSVKDAGSVSHFAALREAVESATAQGRETLYSSRFVLKKDIRVDRALVGLFKEMVAGLTFADHIRFKKAQIVAGSALRFKTQPYFEQVGFRALDWQNQILNPFTHAVSGEEILLMKIDEISQWSQECFEKHRTVIDARMTVALDEMLPQEKQSAA